MTNLKEILKAQEDEFDKEFGFMFRIRRAGKNSLKAWHKKAIIEALDAIIMEIIGEDEDVDRENNYLDDPEVLVPESANSLRQDQLAKYITLKKELEDEK